MSSNLFDLTPRRARVISDPRDVDQFLSAEVGLSVATIARAVEVGLAEAAVVTPHSSKASFGFRLWDGVTRHLRDEQARFGWEPATPGNLEVVRRQDKHVQVTASLGDDCVGDPSPFATPTARHPRGSATEYAIDANSQSLAAISPDDPGWTSIRTWWLLYRPIAPDFSTAIAELSLPVSMVGTKISQWAIRLILTELPFGLGGVRVPISTSSPQDPVPVGIQRRGA